MPSKADLARVDKRTLERVESDAQAAARLLLVLQKHAHSKRGKLSSTRIAAARAALPFLRPALQSIEQTVHNADDELTQDQIFAKFQALIEAHPDMLDRLIAMRAKANPGVAMAGAVQQSGDSHPNNSDSVASEQQSTTG